MPFLAPSLIGSWGLFSQQKENTLFFPEFSKNSFFLRKNYNSEQEYILLGFEKFQEVPFLDCFFPDKFFPNLLENPPNVSTTTNALRVNNHEWINCPMVPLLLMTKWTVIGIFFLNFELMSHFNAYFNNKAGAHFL